MHYGLFGKLPARRDFIAHAVSRPFLKVWEPWLEQAITQARAKLGTGAFEATFSAAPIWRFYWGADICGEAMLGAFMPSMDAVGRYFPLTLIATSESEALAPPLSGPYHAWFEQAENVLLSALEPAMSFEQIIADLARLPKPQAASGDAASEPLFGGIIAERPPLPLQSLFANCRLAYQNCSVAASTFWWTVGGADFRPVGLMRKELPETDLLTDMLTGDFEHRPQETSAIKVKPL